MIKLQYYFLVYEVIISIISIIMVILYKYKARRKKRRISEAALFTVAAIGGSAAMYLTMCLVRHKTQKNSFVFGIPLIFILQCVIIYCFFRN